MGKQKEQTRHWNNTYDAMSTTNRTIGSNYYLSRNSRSITAYRSQEYLRFTQTTGDTQTSIKTSEESNQSRNAHKSTLAGVIMSGIWPIWIQPKIDQHLDIIFDSDAAQIEQALKQFPEAKAVFVTAGKDEQFVLDSGSRIRSIFGNSRGWSAAPNRRRGPPVIKPSPMPTRIPGAIGAVYAAVIEKLPVCASWPLRKAVSTRYWLKTFREATKDTISVGRDGRRPIP